MEDFSGGQRRHGSMATRRQGIVFPRLERKHYGGPCLYRSYVRNDHGSHRSILDTARVPLERNPGRLRRCECRWKNLRAAGTGDAALTLYKQDAPDFGYRAKNRELKVNSPPARP